MPIEHPFFDDAGNDVVIPEKQLREPDLATHYTDKTVIDEIPGQNLDQHKNLREPEMLSGDLEVHNESAVNNIYDQYRVSPLEG